MALRKQDAYEALQLLVALRNTMDPNDEDVADIDRLTEVMKSPLFQALCEVHEFFMDNIVNTAESPVGASAAQLQRAQDLEWEDAFDFQQANPNPEAGNVEEVELVQGPHGYGISIAGGIDRPLQDGNDGIFITGLVPDGPAALSGRLFVGDELLSVNGHSLEHKTHHQVIAFLQEAQSMVLVVEHGVLEVHSPTQINTVVEEITLHKPPVGGLGFTIAGGTDAPHVPNDTGIFVTKIVRNGAANKQGQIAVGDKILKVNGIALYNMVHDEVVSVLKHAEGIVKLTIEKNGYSKAVAMASSDAHTTGFNSAFQFTRTGTLKSFDPEVMQQLRQRQEQQESEQQRRHQSSVRATSKRLATVTDVGNGFGFSILGPSDDDDEQSGIFVSAVQPSGAAAAAGLRVGDRILSINDVDLTDATFNEALDVLRTRSGGDTMAIQLDTSAESLAKYKQMKHLSDKKKRASTVHIQALFDYDPQHDTGLTSKEKRRELLPVTMHDVFLLKAIDKKKDWWLVQNTGTSQVGYVPSASRWNRLHAVHTPKADGSRSVEEQVSSTKRRKSFRFARRLSFGRKKRTSSASLTDKDGDSCYRVVTLVDPASLRYPRPLILLGPGKDYLTDQLFATAAGQFSSCVPHTTRPPRAGEVHGEDYYFTKSDVMKEGLDRDEFIEAGIYQDHLYGTSFRALEEASENGQVCILDVNTQAIKRLEKHGITPLVIFCKPQNKEAVSRFYPEHSQEAIDAVHSLALQVYNDYRSQFTSVVSIASPQQAFVSLQQTLHDHDSQRFWAPTQDTSLEQALELVPTQS
eukprot:m.27203 g.27203  ORF g.27203 m.27203 type:complete len:803 (-) comp8909_c0_seq2:466-2874(-)